MPEFFYSRISWFAMRWDVMRRPLRKSCSITTSPGRTRDQCAGRSWGSAAIMPLCFLIPISGYKCWIEKDQSRHSGQGMPGLSVSVHRGLSYCRWQAQGHHLVSCDYLQESCKAEGKANWSVLLVLYGKLITDTIQPQSSRSNRMS